MTLRARIILGYILLVAASFSFILYLVMEDIKPRYRESVEDSIVDTAELLAAILSEQTRDGALRFDNVQAAMNAMSRRVFAAKIYDIEKHNVNLRVYITDHNGHVLYDSTGQARPGTDFSQWRDVYLTLRGQYGARTTRSVLDDPTSSTLYVAAPILKDDAIIGVVTVGKPQDGIATFIRSAQNKFRLAVALTGLTAIGIAVLLSTWITWPMRKLTAYVRSVRAGVPARLPVLRSPEIKALGAAISDMQTELEGKTYIEDYVRALTHEMKSPLTGIKGAAEILRDHVSGETGGRFLNHIEADANRMQSLIDRMLQLSRLENVRSITKTRVRAETFFQELADAFASRLAEKNIRLDLDIPASLSFAGDALLLHQALGNLLANALDFSPPGSVIAVRVSATTRLDITVRDYGTGMPDYALAKAFDKFFSLARPGTAVKSTGLGLPFVREVILLHGGSVRLEHASPGLAVHIVLPLD